jgi:hypothetical protein
VPRGGTVSGLAFTRVLSQRHSDRLVAGQAYIGEEVTRWDLLLEGEVILLIE